MRMLRELFPFTKAVPPVTANLASGSFGTTLIETAFVPRGRVTIEPAAVSTLLIKMFFTPASLEAGTVTVTLKLWVAPLSAVTRAVTKFEPKRKPVAPVITTLDLASFAVATTETLVVPGLTSTTPLVGAWPSMVKTFKLVSVDTGRTNRVTV